MAGRAFALALAAHALDIGDGGVDDVALVGVHRLHLVVAAGADDAVCNALGKGREVVLALVAVAADIQAQLDIGAFHAVHNEAGEVGQALHRLTAAADECAHVLAGDFQDGGSALLDGGEAEVFHTHQVEDGSQVVNRSLQARVSGDIERDLNVVLGNRGQLGGLDHILNDCFLDFGGSLVGDFNNFCRLGGNFGRFFLSSRGRGGLGFLDLYQNLGRDGFEQLAGGKFQHFIADIDIVTVNAQGFAGGLHGGFNGLGAHFHTAHNGGPPSYFLFLIVTFITKGSGAGAYRMRPYGGRGYTPSQPPTARASNARPYDCAASFLSLCSAGWCARLCRARLPAGGHVPGAACWPHPG